MRSILFLSLVLTAVLFMGCSVTSEKYRYQWRMDRFYGLLSAEEKAAFKTGSLDKLGLSLEKRVSADSKLSNQYINVQIYEAITAFDAAQTAHFFRFTILKELNRAFFYRFMDSVDAQFQLAFARNDSGVPGMLDSLAARDGKIQSMIRAMKTEYRLYDMNTSELISFYRKVSFPEVSRRELYHVLRHLKAAGALELFTAGRITEAAAALNTYLSASRPALADFRDVQKRSSLNKISVNDFLDIYYSIIMKEMDQGAVERTLKSRLI